MSRTIRHSMQACTHTQILQQERNALQSLVGDTGLKFMLLKLGLAVGLAPEMFNKRFAVQDLNFSISLITMEQLPEAWRVLSDISDSELMEAKPHALQALLKAQNVEIGMGVVGAHGDMRQPRVAVLLEDHQWHIRFLDFDWAGVAGEDTYPPYRPRNGSNPRIAWPAGA